MLGESGGQRSGLIKATSNVGAGGGAWEQSR